MELELEKQRAVENEKHREHELHMNTIGDKKSEVKGPPHFDLLYSLYGERPLDRPQTISCGLQPEGEGAATPEGQLSAEEDVGEPIQLPQQPTAARPKVKRRRVGPPSHSERIERMHYNLMQTLKEYQEKSLSNQREMIETYKKAQDKRNALLRSIFETGASSKNTDPQFDAE
ncbi:hypothetical protein Pcinc_010645 [Petrolisthes cinctipes]|uniref:Uncharacterized protein n=1 Tax=Petrolisthes cinctipes TaxID=88211 RepID=A0AAE1G4G1_PETCI|nr:hypothetical protein Pcinc_015251 [Petrolisthes cinctipes]KAK3885094.1 hypothetical protein Pcinc_010645 [Petrolisthes cinctipes]